MSEENAFVQVTFSNGEGYNIPASLIAENRAEYYANKFEGDEGSYDEIFEKEYEFTLNERLELLDWLSNNMNWCDVENEAERVEKEEIDKESEFVNAKKEYITG